ncbi:MAG: hypothetical protein IJ867_02385 [Clostridia bacterium]|nr:hypothetical protein [Clostridia bacterium]
MATYIHDYYRAGAYYRTKEEAQDRLERIKAANAETERERIAAGRGPFTTTTKLEVIGDIKHGYFVRETIIK